MKRNILYFLLLTALILFNISCGIPSIYVPNSSDVVINPTDPSSGTFTVTISSTTLNELTSSSPDLYFFYTISENSQKTIYSSLISSFNTKYAEDTNGTNISSTLLDQPFLTYTSDDKNYGLYQFSNCVSVDISNISEAQFTLTKDDSGYLTLRAEDDEIKTKITRYNEETFSSDDISSSHNEIVDYSDTNTYYVRVYATISCQFTSYSNTYNTKIDSSYPIYEFIISAL